MIIVINGLNWYVASTDMFKLPRITEVVVGRLAVVLITSVVITDNHNFIMTFIPTFGVCAFHS